MPTNTCATGSLVNAIQTASLRLRADPALPIEFFPPNLWPVTNTGEFAGGVLLAEAPNNGSALTWVTGSSAPYLHVVRLSNDGSESEGGATFPYYGMPYGLRVRNNGAVDVVAARWWTSQVPPSGWSDPAYPTVAVPDKTSLVWKHLNAKGEPVSEIELVAAATAPNQKIIAGDALGLEVLGMMAAQRTIWRGDGSFVVFTGISRNFGTQTKPDHHQGDSLMLFDSTGKSMSGGWDWGNSHSYNQRLGWDGMTIGTVADTNRGPGGKHEIRYNRNKVVAASPLPGAPTGSAELPLSALLPDPAGGFWLLHGDPVSASAKQRIDLLRIANDGTVNRRTTLSNNGYRAPSSTVRELRVRLARYGNGFVASWSESAGKVVLQRLDSTGTPVGDAETFDPGNTSAWFDFMTYRNGDIGWVYSQYDNPTSSSTLRIVRLRCN